MLILSHIRTVATRINNVVDYVEHMLEQQLIAAGLLNSFIYVYIYIYFAMSFKFVCSRQANNRERFWRVHELSQQKGKHYMMI
jgi:hypothetical protein